MSLLRALPKQLWAPLLVLLLVSGVIASLFGSEPSLVQTKTSYGGPIYAWGAVYDLLHELGLGVTRSRLPLAQRDVAQTQWIIEPVWSDSDARYQADEVERFAKAGGSVVLIGADDSVWAALSFLVLDGSSESAAKSGNSNEWHRTLKLRGPWLPRVRKLEVSQGVHFDASSSAGSEPRVQDGYEVLVLERVVGKGRVIAVADSSFLSNQRLGDQDNAAFVMDLVRAYGVPTFDERCHGLTVPHSPWAALGAGFLLLATLALALLALAALLHARRWPLPAHTDDTPAAPTLEVFTTSLANLYRVRGERDAAAVFRAYRLGYLRRLQYAVSGDRDSSQARFEARIEADASHMGPDGHWLRAAAAPSSRAELLSAVSALERYGAAITHRKRMR